MFADFPSPCPRRKTTQDALNDQLVDLPSKNRASFLERACKLRKHVLTNCTHRSSEASNSLSTWQHAVHVSLPPCLTSLKDIQGKPALQKQRALQAPETAHNTHCTEFQRATSLLLRSCHPLQSGSPVPGTPTAGVLIVGIAFFASLENMQAAKGVLNPDREIRGSSESELLSAAALSTLALAASATCQHL